MEIKSDVSLKGGNWRKALDVFAPFFPQSLQPNYSIFVISMSIGIMYDRQLDVAGEESEEEKDNRPESLDAVKMLHANEDHTYISSEDLYDHMDKIGFFISISDFNIFVC